MKSLIAAAFTLLACVLMAHRADAQTFATGSCVLANGVPATVLGPSSNVQGAYMVRDARLHAGEGQALMPDRLKPGCPGAPVVKNVCFASSPDEDGKTDLERAIRQAIRLNDTRLNIPSTTRFESVDVGQPRVPTDLETADLGEADFSKGIVPARITYEICSDDDRTIRVTRFIRNVTCFISRATGKMMCGTAAAEDMTNAEEKSFPKY